MIKNIEAFTSKQKLGRAIDGVLIMPDKIVATDSFKLIELKGDTGAADSFTVKLPKGLKTFERVERVGTGANIYHKGAKYEVAEVGAADEYPKHEAIWPTGEPVASVILDAGHLAAICAAFESASTTGVAHIEIKIYEENKAVEFTSKTGVLRALLMPVLK